MVKVSSLRVVWIFLESAQVVLFSGTPRLCLWLGTNTWDRFEMRIHKRIIDLNASADILKKIVRTLQHWPAE